MLKLQYKTDWFDNNVYIEQSLFCFGIRLPLRSDSVITSNSADYYRYTGCHLSR